MSSTGVEELGHLEMVGTIVHQLTKNLTEKQIEENPGFAAYFIDHTTGVYPTAASGFPWSAASIQSRAGRGSYGVCANYRFNTGSYDSAKAILLRYLFTIYVF